MEASERDRMNEELPRASLIENLRFNAVVVIPNAVQGLFRRRRAAVAAASRAGVDGQAVALLSGMARGYERSPVWVRLGRSDAVLLLDPADVEAVLDASPDLYAADPPAKREGMVAFQPDAVTISRGALWRNRRRFNEAVLRGSGGGGLLRTWLDVCDKELQRMLAGPVAVAAGELDWDSFHGMFERVARRIVLGDGAAEDEPLTTLLAELMSEANGMPGETGPRVGELEEMIASHVDRADRGSLVARFSGAPSDARTNSVGQVPHWLFAMGDTLAINAYRALAVLGSDAGVLDSARADGDYLEACLQEAMRLWPTTAMLSRETIKDVELRGEVIPEGTQVVICNVFGHRDRDRLDYADRFAPERWIDGEAGADPAFNQFARGPQGCPGRSIAMGVGREILGGLIERHTPVTTDGAVNLERPLPHMLDFFGIHVRLDPA